MVDEFMMVEDLSVALILFMELHGSQVQASHPQKTTVRWTNGRLTHAVHSSKGKFAPVEGAAHAALECHVSYSGCQHSTPVHAGGLRENQHDRYLPLSGAAGPCYQKGAEHTQCLP